ncbi:hypothetical protein [Schaalia sp. lx-100]|uniref:hypothetical protein n=1 Tax=Schaalia sp. lx-100 TaxID=2899081 RepID=UPI001E61B553|nr:hypothetical protein [Schaalia sp. lx-100]MCD4557210.1 hypothetical protein [Schaalia sp. lx-100]
MSYSIASGTLAADAPSVLEIAGSGFQSVKGGFGGIYVFFGWVDDPYGMSWSPSNGGLTGVNYRYAYDDETNPAGYQLFVAFPGSSTSFAANGGQINADGTWNGQLTIPGAQFTTYDRSGNASQVDCTQVQCGIITIGAHGQKNAHNESFTPVNFSTSTAPAPAAAPGVSHDTTTGNNTQNTTAENKENTNEPLKETPDNESNISEEDTTGESASLPEDTTIRRTTATKDAGTPYVQVSEDNRVSTWLLIFSAVIAAATLVFFAIGTGAYLAIKTLIVGISPQAAQREEERRKVREEKREQRPSRRSYRRRELENESAPSLSLPRSSQAEETRVLPALEEVKDTHAQAGTMPSFFTDQVKGKGE